MSDRHQATRSRPAPASTSHSPMGLETSRAKCSGSAKTETTVIPIISRIPQEIFNEVPANVTDVRFEPVEPRFEPEPHLFEPLLAVRFRRVRMGSVSGSPPGISQCTRANAFEPVEPVEPVRVHSGSVGAPLYIATWLIDYIFNYIHCTTLQRPSGWLPSAPCHLQSYACP